MKEKNDNSDNLSNIDKRYELLHAAREYSFDSFLTDVDYKKPILLNEIKRTVRLHATEQNLRVYFSLLALIDTFKVMLNTVHGNDRVVFGDIDDVDIIDLIETDSDEELIINASTEIGHLFLSIVFHAAAIREGFPDYILHPYVQIVLDEKIDQVVASIEQNMTIRVNYFKFLPEIERKYFIDDFIIKAKSVAGEVNNLFFCFIDKLNSSAVKNKKDVFDKKGDRSAGNLDDFIGCVKTSKDDIHFVFRLSLAFSDCFKYALRYEGNSVLADIFNRSLSDFNVEIRRRGNSFKYAKVFHVLKSSKGFGLYTDSYFVISYNGNGIPFAKEQVALWCASNSIFSDFFKDKSQCRGFKKISDYFNWLTSKGVNLDAFLKDIKCFYKNKTKNMSTKELAGIFSIENIKDKKAFMLLQQNFEICAFIDNVKSMWSGIIADNMRSKLMLHEESENVHSRCSGVVLVRDVFKVKNGTVESLTQDFTWKPKREITGLKKKKDKAAYYLMVKLLYLQPFFRDKAKSRNAYVNSIKSFTSTEDLFGATTKRLIAELKFLKLNLKVGNKQLDEIRIVNYKKPKKTQESKAI